MDLEIYTHKNNGQMFELVSKTDTRIELRDLESFEIKVEEDHWEETPFIEYFNNKYSLLEC